MAQPFAAAEIMLRRCFELEPRLSFEAEDYILTASWPDRHSNSVTYSSVVAFGVRDAMKLLSHILERFDERANNA